MRNVVPLAIALTVTLLLASCAGHDDDYFPYRMKGLDVWVYDSTAEKDIYAGFVEASYRSRAEGLAACASQAADVAAANRLTRWSHVCCTVTDESQCATKVR